MLRKIVLILLLAYIVEHAPWRLMALLAETFFVRSGSTRVAQTNDRYWEARMLQERIEEMGYSVKYTKNLSILTNVGVLGVYGLTSPTHHTVEIEEGLSWDARYAILAHEGGHALSNSPIHTLDEAEAFAEAVATLVANNGLREHARYLSSRKMALFTVIMLDHAKIYRTAATLME